MSLNHLYIPLSRHNDAHVVTLQALKLCAKFRQGLCVKVGASECSGGLAHYAGLHHSVEA
jgi:hypothetical protein